MATNTNKTIILKGYWSNYTFKPLIPRARLRKISKFSRVYKGWTDENKPVVIKVLPDDLANDHLMVRSFKNEINWFGLHPNILAPYEYIFHEGRHFLVSEFVQAIDLGFYYRKKRLFKKTRIFMALQCGLQLLDAVECMHKQGRIHADIKPANVMLLTIKRKRPDYKNPIFKLIDFGMVRKAGSPPVVTNKKHQRPFVLVYSPPEQVLGAHELVSYTSDLYNIALLMYELIAKERVYESNISLKLMNLQTSFPLPHNKSIPSELMAILHKAASKYHFKRPPNHYKPEAIRKYLAEGIAQRYQSADEFRQALLCFKQNYFK